MRRRGAIFAAALLVGAAAAVFLFPRGHGQAPTTHHVNDETEPPADGPPLGESILLAGVRIRSRTDACRTPHPSSSVPDALEGEP